MTMSVTTNIGRNAVILDLHNEPGGLIKAVLLEDNKYGMMKKGNWVVCDRPPNHVIPVCVPAGGWYHCFALNPDHQHRLSQMMESTPWA